MKNIIYTLLVISLLTILRSCGIKPKDVTIMNGLVLGATRKEFFHQLEKSGANKQALLTKLFFTSINEVNNNVIENYYTDLFRMPDYESQYLKHYGIFFPVEMDGTQNVTGLIILLVHTSPVVTNYGRLDPNKFIGLSQNITDKQSKSILEILVKAHGNPSDSLELGMNAVLKFENSTVKWFTSYDSPAFQYQWKKKYFTIKYFEGIDSKEESFDPISNSYMVWFDETAKNKQYPKTHKPCVSYAYISYSLNDKALEKLKLNKPLL